MKKIAFIVIPIFFLLAFTRFQHQADLQPIFTGYEWAVDVFEKAEIVRTQHPPYEIQDLPIQLKELGLEQEHILFGRKFASFDQFRQAFEEAEAEHQQKVKALTSWDMSSHQGVSVHSRVYQIEDRGIAVAFFRPNVIIADLGPYEGSIEIRDALVEKNK